MQDKLLAVFSGPVGVKTRDICAQLGISRQTVSKYRRRFEQEGPPGLVERSRRPHNSPTMVSAAMEDEIVRLRKELVIDNGAQAIGYHLARREDLGPIPSTATIHRVLVRRGMVVPEPKKRPLTATRRFVWPRPNDAWQIDATAWALADGRNVWIMDILDDHSRVLIAARVCDGPTSQAAWDAFVAGVRAWGLPAHVMSDNGLCFTGRFHNAEADFERQLRGMGIAHLPSSPGHPQTCGKLERSHSTTKRWLTTQPAAKTKRQLQAQLDRWLDHYNNHRPHSALRGRTPNQAWLATERAEPTSPLPGPRRTSLHLVDREGRIGWNSYMIRLERRLAGQQVLVVANDLHVVVHGQQGVLRELDIDPTRRYQPSGKPRHKPPA